MDTVVIAADTVVALDGYALGKPGDRDEAVDMLRKLQGRQHQVVTTVAVTYAPHRQRGESLAHTVVTKVNMREYYNSEIYDYVATGLPYDRAGAYGVQDGGFNPAESVIGCYLNVVDYRSAQSVPCCHLDRARLQTLTSTPPAPRMRR